MSKKLAVTTVCILGLTTSPITWAGFFPEAGVDKAPSLAQFVITFTDRDFINNHPELGLCDGPRNVCSDEDRTVISPILYESQTKIGRSRPHFHSEDSSSVDVGEGASVCKEGMWNVCFDFFTNFVTDSDFVRQWNQGPVGTDEVHTRMLSMNLTPLRSSRYNPSNVWNSANRIRGGSAAPDQPSSIGEVESLDAPGGEGGFPAESFFNMNVEVDMDLDFDGTVDFTLVTRGVPLLVTGTGLTNFPPKLVYVHNSTVAAIPIYDKADTSNDPEAIAYLRMAGHGMSYGSAFSTQTRDGKNTRDSEDPEVEEFLSILHSQPLLPMPPSGEPPVCQLYAVQDHGLNNSQIYTISPETFDVEPISVRYPKHDLEGLDTHPISDKLYLTSGNDSKKPGYLFSFDVETAELTEIGDTSFGDVPSIAFNSEGVLWGWVKDKGLITINTQSGQGTMVKEFPDVSIEDITWSNEGKYIYASEGTNLWVYEYAKQTATLACNNLPGETEALEMLPDDTLLLGIHGNKKVVKFKAFNVETCEITFDVDIPTSPTVNDVEGIAWPMKACSS